MKDYDESLGIQKTATADEIKKAYRNLAFKYHPDRNPDDKVAEERFKEISEAYAVLSDDRKRAEYDRYGSYSGAQNEYSGTRSGGYQQSPFGSEEDFWQWFRNGTSQNQNEYENSFYDSSYTNRYEKEPVTRMDLFGSFLIRILQTFVGFILFKAFWWLLPFGPLVCLGIIGTGISGAVKSLRDLLHFNAGGK